MCGRYTLNRRQEELIERFNIEELLLAADELQPRYNIAPSQMVPVVLTQDGKRVLTEFKWGLIPFWAKDLSKTKPVINARSETMAEKPFFRTALARKRCIIPADGFYEWKHQGKEKIPMYIQMKGNKAFGFAGLWDEWKSPDGEVLRTCTIITTAANNTMAPVHDRMPIIIRPDHESLWLDPDVKEPAKLEEALEPLPDNALEMHQVSTRVNSPKFDTPDLIEAVPNQTSLWDNKPC